MTGDKLFVLCFDAVHRYGAVVGWKSKDEWLLCFDAVHRYGAVELAERPFQPSQNDDSNN